MSEQLLEDNRHKSWWRLFWYLVWMQNCDLCPDAKALDWLCGPTIWFSSLHGSLPVNAPLFYQPRVKSKAQCHSGCCLQCSEVGHLRELAWHLFFSGDIAKHIWEENKAAKNTKLYLTGSKLNIHQTQVLSLSCVVQCLCLVHSVCVWMVCTIVMVPTDYVNINVKVHANDHFDR